MYCTAKNLGVTPDYVLNEMSYINVPMYGYATPRYDSKKRKEADEWDDSIDANNPDNFNGSDEEEFVR